MDSSRILDFRFLSGQDKLYSYSVIITLNDITLKNFFSKIREKMDYFICGDGTSNILYDSFGIEKY